jgi:hypothetical protein
MLYILLDGKKERLDDELIVKYSLKEGMAMPFSGYVIHDDSSKDKKE